MRKITQTVTVQRPVTVQQTVGVEVELTIEEYVVLRLILGKIGGDPGNTLRGHANSISKKLSSREDLNFYQDSPHSISHDLTGSWVGHEAMFEGRGSIVFAEGSKNSILFKRLVQYYKGNIK